MSTTLHIDLKDRGELPAHTFLYYQIRELAGDQVAEVICDETPELMLESVALQLRDEISWQIIEAGPPQWRVRITPRQAAAIKNLRDLLQRDHLRLDKLFAKALHATNAGDMHTAAEALQEFAVGLQRHVHAENDILAPSFKMPQNPFAPDPVAMMLNEHDQIQQQVAILQSYFEDGLPQAEEVAPFFGLLSGQLAKHEGREEQNLFPLWERALQHAGADAEQQLVKRIQNILAGAED